MSPYNENQKPEITREQQAEIDRLQQEIAGLEDTIVEQQEELNAFYNQS